jgi:hypothetical protein
MECDSFVELLQSGRDGGAAVSLALPERGGALIPADGRGSVSRIWDERGLVRIRVGCEFHFDAAVAVPAVVLLRAAPDGGVTVERETWHVQPNSSFSDLVDVYGNRARRVVIAAGKASLRPPEVRLGNGSLAGCLFCGSAFRKGSQLI